MVKFSRWCGLDPGRRRFHLCGPALLLVIGLVVLLQSGCAVVPPAPPMPSQTALGRVAVVAGAQMPEIGFEGVVHGKAQGAAFGAGSSFLSCMGALGQGSCTGSVCGALVIVMLGVCGVAGLVGGVSGAVMAPGADRVEAAQSTLVTALDARTIQESLRAQLEAAAQARGTPLVAVPADLAIHAAQQHDYRPLAAAGVDTVLEVALTQVGTRGFGIDAPVQLHMRAQARLIRTQDNTETGLLREVHQGARLKLAEWSTEQAAPLLQALGQGYEQLGAQIHDDVFALYEFPDRQAHAIGWLATATGLAPLAPETLVHLTGDPFLGRYLEWQAVDSLRPTLRWQGFPRGSDLAMAPAEMARVTQVRYDLLVASEHNLVPVEIVYRRTGLPDAAHALEVALPPASRYFWTVRARFQLDGRERVTPWAGLYVYGAERQTAPSRLSYRFRTP